MSAIVSPRGLRLFRSACHGASLCALGLLTPVLLPTSARAEVQEPMAAVWRERQLQFTYLGFMAVYPCHVLQHRIARVLSAVGARSDLKVALVNCDPSVAAPTVVSSDGAGWPAVPPRGDTSWLPGPLESGSGAYRRSEPRQVVAVQVRLSMPAAMTPEVIAELKTDRKRREFIAEVTGDPMPLFDDPIAFVAQRKVVTLSNETTGIEPADCELLDQMAATVFRRLGVRVVRKGYTCDRMWVSRIRPILDVEALVPVSLLPTGGGPSGASARDRPDPRPSEDPGGTPAKGDAGPKPQ